MSKANVIALLEKGSGDKEFRVKYDSVFTKERFVEEALKDGFDFTVQELSDVIRANGDSFDNYGNPPKRSIWD
jgi:hypothetical protein